MTEENDRLGRFRAAALSTAEGLGWLGVFGTLGASAALASGRPGPNGTRVDPDGGVSTLEDKLGLLGLDIAPDNPHPGPGRR